MPTALKECDVAAVAVSDRVMLLNCTAQPPVKFDNNTAVPPMKPFDGVHCDGIDDIDIMDSPLHANAATFASHLSRTQKPAVDFGGSQQVCGQKNMHSSQLPSSGHMSAGDDIDKRVQSTQVFGQVDRGHAAGGNGLATTSAAGSSPFKQLTSSHVPNSIMQAPQQAGAQWSIATHSMHSTCASAHGPVSTPQLQKPQVDGTAHCSMQAAADCPTDGCVTPALAPLCNSKQPHTTTGFADATSLYKRRRCGNAQTHFAVWHVYSTHEQLALVSGT